MSKPIALYGPTGIGKTMTLYQTLTKKVGAKRILLCRNIEDLAEFKDQTDIIFDDLSFNLCRAELLIHLCDLDFHSSVRILRRVVKIPPSVRKWFTHNNQEAWQPILASPEQQAAISRRLTVYLIHSRAQVETLVLETLPHERLIKGSTGKFSWVAAGTPTSQPH